MVMDIKTILILLIHEHVISFHSLCLLQFLSLTFCNFQMSIQNFALLYIFITSLAKFILRYFILSDVLLNWIVFFYFGVRVILASYNEFGSVPSCSLSFKKLALTLL